MHLTGDFLNSPDGGTGLALDLGGVFEFYPSGRSIIRFGLGNTRGFFDGGSPFSTNSIHFSADMGIRF